MAAERPSRLQRRILAWLVAKDELRRQLWTWGRGSGWTQWYLQRPKG
jgi:hypothetical protein